MSTVPGLEDTAMTVVSTSAYFYFSYYFFTKKR